MYSWIQNEILWQNQSYTAQREFRVTKVLDKGSRGEVVKVSTKETIGIQATLSELKNYILIAEGLVKLD